MPWWYLLVISLYMAGWIAFAIFYAREEQTVKATIVACGGVALALLLTLFFGVYVGGAITVAATFYVADRKNRSRGWALLSFVIGPVALVIITILPKQVDTSTLSLTT